MPEGLKEVIVSKVIDSLPTLLIVLGGILILLGLAGGIMYNQWFPVRELGARIAAVVMGLLILLWGYFSGNKQVTVPATEKYGIKIEHPRNGDRVEVVDVRGSIKKALPEGHVLKVLRVYPGSENYIPIGEGRIDIKSGTWMAEQCNIGGKTGDKRWIAAYIVGPGGAALLSYYEKAARVHKSVMNQLRSATGKEGEYLPLMDKRTPDMLECDRVSVTRS